MSLQDIINPTEPEPEPEPEPQPAEVVTAKEPKAPMRSWRKKYRKMKLRFDKVMDESNALFLGEHKQIALARRLQEENDQLLDLLLDLNEQRQVPTKYDLRLPSDEELGLDTRLQCDPRDTEDLRVLSTLLKTIPHTEEYTGIQLPEDMTGDKPPGFFDTAYEEEYITNLDAQLAAEPDDAQANSHNGAQQPPLIRPSASRHLPPEKELATTNPNSVISWLRRHHPETFIQEKDANSERSVAKPRGPGKRGSLASAVFSTPGPKSELEIGADADESHHHHHDDLDRKPAGRGRKGANKNPDDDAYRPKGGSGRAGTKRKRVTDGDGDTPKSGGRGKRAKPVPAPPPAE